MHVERRGNSTNGTVTSVGLALNVPSFLSAVITNSPVIAAGTLTGTISLVDQAANTVFAGPANGADAAPTFRALVNADLPVVSVAKGGTNLSAYAAGDLLVATGAATLARLAVGANNDVLGVVAGAPAWGSTTGTGVVVRSTGPTIGGAWLLEENGALQLDSALSADGKYTGITKAGTAAAALTFGQLCYLNSAGKWALADADAASTAGACQLGICVLAAAGVDSPTLMLRYGTVRADGQFPAMTIGAPMFVGLTPGEITDTKPSATDDVVRVVGHAETADELFFNPSPDYITAT